MTPPRRSTSRAQARRTVSDQLAALSGEAAYVVAIDPASTRTGLAVVQVGTEKVIETALASAPAGRPPIDRMREIAADIETWIRELPIPTGPHIGRLPSTIVIAVETPSASRSGQTRKKSGGFGLTTYARAVGRIEHMVEQLAFDLEHVVSVDERTWTGKTPKARRTAHVVATVPEYVPTKDPGQDIADAIGLGLWVSRRLTALRGAA